MFSIVEFYSFTCSKEFAFLNESSSQQLDIYLFFSLFLVAWIQESNE